MTKKIILSLAMIALVIAGVTSATVAYFSDTARMSNNTFSMGTVSVKGEGEGRSDVWQLPLTLGNMIPGQEKISTLFAIKQSGTMPVDFYLGFKVINDQRVRDELSYAVLETNSSGEGLKWWRGKWTGMNDLLNHWRKIGDNANPNTWHYYKLYVYPNLGMSNSLQGKTDTMQLIIYAVQHGSGAPSTRPQDF